MRLTIQQALRKGLERRRIDTLLPEIKDLDAETVDKIYDDLWIIVEDSSLSEQECCEMIFAIPKRYTERKYFPDFEDLF